ncbi:MAG TPA: TonB-dependent receptor, partial [Chryseolinea sp.]
MERRTDQGSNYVAARPSVSGENVSRVNAQDLELVSFVLDSAFGYSTGAYEGFTHKTENQKGIIKLDWNINKSHTLTAIYNFLDAFKDKPAHPNAIGRRGPDVTTLQFYSSGYRINNIIHSAIVELKSTFGNKFANKLQVGRTAFRDSRDPFSTPFPVVNINQDGIRAIVAGHEPFSIHNLLDQDVFQFSDNFNIYTGDHDITIGTSFEKFQFDNSFNLDAYGGTFTPGYNSADEFVDLVRSGGFDDDVDAALTTFSTRNANDSWALAETNVGQWAIYAQDSWRVNEALTLTVGLRGDLPLYFDTDEKIKENLAPDRNCCYDPSVIYYDENGDPVQFDHTKLPDQKMLISPRIGFNWNTDNQFQLRGGSGLFTGRFPFVWVGNQVANPNFFFYNITSPDFKFPQVWRSNLGGDKRLPGGWILSADVIYTKDVNAMMVRNYGLKPPSGSLLGVDNRPIYNAATDRTVPYANNAYVFTNSDKGRTLNVTLEAKREWAGGWYSSLGYNFLDAKDVSSIEAEISSDAYDRNPAFGNVNQSILSPSLYGNKHRVVGTVNKTFTYGQDKFATTLSLFFEYAKGGRFSYTYSGDLNGDGSGLNDLIYIPTDNEINLMAFAGNDSDQASQRSALKSFIAQDDYLNENRGNYAEKYGILSPWFSRYDLRILQDFILANGSKIQFSVDMLNIGNLITSSWGVRQFPSNTQPIGVTVDPAGNPTYSFDPTLKNTFTNDFSLASRWQVQFGLRYTF